MLLLPDPVAAEVDGLRRAFGDPAVDQVAPHITLVPPVNVAAEAYGEALAVLRRAAGGGAALHLRLGPVAAFPTDEHVAYLEVRRRRPRRWPDCAARAVRAPVASARSTTTSCPT